MKCAAVILLCLLTTGCLFFGSLTGQAHPQPEPFVPDETKQLLQRADVEEPEFLNFIKRTPLRISDQDNSATYNLVRVDVPAMHTYFYLTASDFRGSRVIGQWQADGNGFAYGERIVENEAGLWSVYTYKAGWGTECCLNQTVWMHLNGEGAAESLRYSSHTYSGTGDGTGRFLQMDCEESCETTPENEFVIRLQCSKTQDPESEERNRSGVIAYVWSPVSRKFEYSAKHSTWPQSEHDNPWD